MLSTMTSFVVSLLGAISDFLLAEPVIYVIAALLLIAVVRMIKILIH